MGLGHSSVRAQDEVELEKLATINGDEGMIRLKYNIDGTQISESFTKRAEEEFPCSRTGKPLKAKVLSRVSSEVFERVKKKILDPRGPIIRRWNKIFFVACLFSLFVDPLFFYSPVVWEEVCIHMGNPYEVILTIIRSLADAFYLIQIFIRFRTAYFGPPTRLFWRGELVIDSRKITSRYLRKSFWIDLIAALPLPQVFIWIISPKLKGSTMTNTKIVLWFIIIFQYLPRLFLIFPLSSENVVATGVATETAWAAAAYNLILYVLAAHVLGACCYLLTIERQEGCWRSVCDQDPSCRYKYFDCHSVKDPGRDTWFSSSNITNLCNPSSSSYQFGIYGDGLTFDLTSSPFFEKYFYCLWWGVKNMSSFGQNLNTSTDAGEIIFAIITATIGVFLLALLIGNIKIYLEMTTVRLEEWTIRRTDTEQWMHNRRIPAELRQSVRKYEQYKWLATRGVDEEALLKGLPLDLRRDIKRHICLDLVQRLPLFDQMDERMLDAVCTRLKPALCIEGTLLVREGDPVNEMVFIIQGHLDSYTTNGGRPGFFNSCQIGPGDFCGEELLTWALDPRSSDILPSSTRTVKAISEVEAFALRADDLKFVAAQFRRLHSKQLRHAFRFYSHQWRTLAACFIQATWRRFKRRKETAELRAEENLMGAEPEPATTAGSHLAVYAAWLFASNGRDVNMHSESDSGVVSSLQKPAEPDFSVDEENL